MGRIANAAGVTRQVLYNHFGGRADLLLDLCREVDAEVRTPELEERVAGAPDARTALREAVALQGHIKPRIHAVVSAIDRLRATDEAASSAWAERERARYERALALMARLEEEGALAAGWTSETAARLVWASTSQHAWSDLVLGAGWSTDEWVVQITALLERALLRDPRRRSQPSSGTGSLRTEADGAR